MYVPAGTEWRRFNFVRIGACFGGLFAFGYVFGFAIFPPVLHKMIGGAVALKPGSDMRAMYTDVPFALTFKVYLFNILNPDEVTQGGKPRLQEIGPYVFDEWKHKFDMVDDEADDTLEYRMTNTFIFRPDLSNGLSGQETITTVHPLIMPMALSVNVDKKPMLDMANKAINAMFNAPRTPFWTGRVMDLLFDGIDIDCGSAAFEAQATCSVLSSGDVRAVRVVNETSLKLSLMGGANATSLGVYRVRRGVQNYRDVGRMLAFEGEVEMDVWGTDECNQYHGTDSSIFPPFLKREQGLWAYEPSLCLSIGATYVGPSKYAGIPTWEYTLDLGDPKNDPELQCFCMNPPDDCPRAGTIGLFQCVGAPMVISLPHFYKADPEILTHFAGGLRPNHADHNLFIHFEHNTGGPLSAAKRLQFSIDMVPLPQVDCMKSVPETLMPMFWMEESVHLNETYTKAIKNQLIRMIKIVSIFKWTSMVIGLIGAAAAGYLHYVKISNPNEVSPVKHERTADQPDSVMVSTNEAPQLPKLNSSERY